MVKPHCCKFEIITGIVIGNQFFFFVYYGECMSESNQDNESAQLRHQPGLSLGGDLGVKVSLNWFTSPCFELRQKLKCIEYIGKYKICPKTAP